ncbi:MAG TPA: DUF1592 domain-containing protein [Planctomycetota bacterium]|nr:DUF1592 domain-containing protein [Planctomycetota bacterium]
MRSGAHSLLLILCLAPAARAADQTPVAVQTTAAPTAAKMDEKHRAFFASYCTACHNEEKKKGQVRLDNLSFTLDSMQTAEAWQKVLNVINKGDMPPEGSKFPAEPEKAAFLEALSVELVKARKLLGDQHGKITMRRLNRREYANTLRELLGVEIDVRDLPSDSGAGAFDTFGASLFFSQDQFERYLELGRRALDEALVEGGQPERKKVRRETEIDANREVRHGLHQELLAPYRRAKAWKASNGKSAREFGFTDDADAKFKLGEYEAYGATYAQYLAMPYSDTGSFLCIYRPRPYESIEIPKDAPAGRYLLRIRTGKVDGAPEGRAFMELRLNNAINKRDSALIDTYQVSASVKQPQVIEIPVQITKSGCRSFLLREKRHAHESAESASFHEHKNRTGVAPDPALWIDWVEWEGPIFEQWPSAAQQRLFFKGEPPATNDESYAREVIIRFAERAFRGKAAQPQFIEKLVRLYRARRAAGENFMQALKEPLAVVLASPSFLYLAEPLGTQTRRELSDLELAVRLSYFLWSAPPDDELLTLAKDQRLKTPEMQRAQVDRMLNDKRARDLVRGFVHQWLDLERLNFFRFNFKRYPTFDEPTKIYSGEEVYETVQTLLQENLSLSHLLASDFVVINGLLANHYGIPGVKGDKFRKITLPPDSPRGGLLGMAAILAMGSNGEITSPVERGAFVLRKVLNDPPPPAPAGIPQLSRVPADLSPRERLVLHQEQAQCAHCHRKIDPLGFGLENFDAAGVWRNTERYKKGKELKDWEIDASGNVPDGVSFRDFFEYRALLKERKEKFARGFTEALIAYALGRPFGFSDDDLASEVMNKARADDFKIRSFIHAIVQSQAFSRK